MGLMAKEGGNSGGSNFKMIPAGSYSCRCIQVIDLGTQNFEYLGEKKKSHKVSITWELPTELEEFKEGEGKQPRIISKEFTLSLHEKSKLRPFLENWRGKSFTPEELKGFDIANLIGAPGLISVIHETAKNGNTYANVGGVTVLPKGMECPNQINPSLKFDVDNYEQDVLDSLPNFIQDKIKASDEYQKANSGIGVTEAQDVFE